MGFASDSLAIENRLKAEWLSRGNEGKVYFHGEQANASERPRVAIKVVGSGSNSLGLGNAPKERTGTALVQVFTGSSPENILVGKQLADEVVDIFSNWSTPDGKLVMMDPRLFEVPEQGSDYQINVNIGYRAE